LGVEQCNASDGKMADLFQSETDGSSFPNGGLRATHTAAAFMAWDTFQPPFVISETLYIPSVFLSFRGHALDYKTPLLRAEHALDLAATKLLKHLGDAAVQHVFSNVGWEQEFFLVDRELWLKRDDLTTCGRALFGVPPLGGQERSEHYFSRINPRAEAVMTQVRNRLWEIGVTISVMHNEVAPSQHEISPIFTLSARAADWNMIAMEMLHRVAYENGMAALLHEKPFKGLNGSGKHNNWGINTDTGANLFVVGKTPAEQRRFVAMVAALMRAVRHHGDLLRIGVSTSGNDHRLGAQEAPPAIFTLYVGKGLEDHLRAAADGGPLDGYGVVARTQEVVPSVQPINTNLEDRNRTAPFPWCGNRFELRAVGSNQHMAWPIALVNSAIADSFQFMNGEIEKGIDADVVIRAVLKENIGVLFSGDGYDAPLLQSVAKQNGLFHLTSTPDAWAELTSAKNVAMFKRVGVFEADELEARQNIAYTRFTQDVEIEARTALHMLRHAIIPAVRADITADAAAAFSARGIDAKRQLTHSLLEATDALEAALTAMPHASSHEAALYAGTTLRAALQAARVIADQLETRIPQWPYPSVEELVSSHH
jgi:glutamine synthetase